MDQTTDYKAEQIITATELKSNLGKFLDDVVLSKRGIALTKNGSKVARLVPYIEDLTGYRLIKEEAAQYQSAHVSYEEFLEISEKIEARMEFINGEIVMQAAPNSFHQEIVGNLYVPLKQYLKGKPCKVFLAPFDVTLFKKDIKTPDVVQPDLLIACNTDVTINDKGRYSGVPTLVIEVLSPSTRSRDMLDKLNTYMRSGCSEYWVVDVNNQRLLQYTFKDLDLEAYEMYTSKQNFSSTAFTDLEIDLADIFQY